LPSELWLNDRKTAALISKHPIIGMMKKTADASQGKFTVILRKEQGGGYAVQCVELPGAISEGDTKREALGNIREAIQGYLEAFPEEEERLKLKKEILQVTI